MRVEWTDEFDHWLARLETQVEQGNEHASRQLDYVAAELAFLRDLEDAPQRDDETAQLKWVRQHGKHEIWRVSHRFDRAVAIRLIVWFAADEDTVVVTVFAGDKKRIGDAFYTSAGTRADAAIERWLYERDHAGSPRGNADEEEGDDNGHDQKR